MKTILATLATLGLAASPAFAMCGHDRMAQSSAPVEVAQAMTTPDSIDMEATGSIPVEQTIQDTVEPVTE